MDNEEIIRMARDSGLEIGVEFIAGHKTNIERFAALVAEPLIETNKALAKEIIELKEQAEQEPVAREHELIDIRCGCCGYMTYHREHMGCIKAAAPVRTKDLTDDEILFSLGVVDRFEYFEDDLKKCVEDARAVIAADREKNNANNNT